MRSPSYLYRRHGIFYFRWNLPPSCRARLAPCPADIRLSLGTYQHATARQLAAMMWLRALTLSDHVLAGMAAVSYNGILKDLKNCLSMNDLAKHTETEDPTTLVTLVSLLESSSPEELRDAVGQLFAAGAPLTVPVQCHADIHIEEPVDDQDTTRRQYDRVQNFSATVLLERQHVSNILASSGHQFSISEFRWHPSEPYGTKRRDAYIVSPDEPVTCLLIEISTTKQFGEILIDQGKSKSFSTAKNPDTTTSLFKTTLDDGLSEWLMAKSDWAHATQESASAPIRHLIQVVGNKNPKNVTPSELVRFVDMHRRLPHDYFHKQKKYEGKSIDAVSSEAKAKGTRLYSSKTIANKADWISRYFSYLFERGYIAKNIATNLAPSAKKNNARDAKDPFSDDDIGIIFGSRGMELISKYIKRERKQIAIWGPLIALFTGARAQEIALLTTENITSDVDGIKAIHITDANSNPSGLQQVKTPSSRRRIPIHPKLIELGFLEFVEGRKSSGNNPLLFPEVEQYTNVNKRHTAMTKWFNDILLVKTGVKTNKKSFHSLRHSVVQKLRKDGSLTYQAHEFTGHESFKPAGTKRSTQTETYGGYFSPTQLTALFPLLDYNVDWSAAKGLTKSLGYSSA